MKREANKTLMIGGAVLIALALGVHAAWADRDKREGGDYDHGQRESSHGKGGYGHDGRGKGDGHGMGMGMMRGWHASTGHLLRHMLKHEKDLGLKEDQVAKLKDMQLTLDKTRIKTEADIMIAERELRALVEDDKADLAAIEAKLKESETQEIALRLAAIKTRKEALGLLTPDQRTKLKAAHERMMPQHQMEGGAAGGSMRKDEGKQ
jgi:protein CpxP